MSRIALVGEAYGEFEAVADHPFVGVSGVCLFDLLCDADWITRSDQDRADIRDFWWFYRQWQSSGKPGERDHRLIEPRPMMRIWGRRPEFLLTNVFNLRPPNNDLSSLCVPKIQAPSGLPSFGNGKYLGAQYLGELTRLGRVLEGTGLIVAIGGAATWALLHNPFISKIRGTVAAATALVPGRKLIPCYHPAMVLRKWELRHITVLDLIKAKGESTFPEVRRPKRKIYICETLDDLYAVRKWPASGRIAPDIETKEDEITCITFALSPQEAIEIPITDPRRPNGRYWSTFAEEKFAWDTIRALSHRPEPKVFQNGLYDINFLWSKYGMTPNGEIEDSMLAHWAIQPESQKGLDFLGSYLTNEPAWKLMNRRGKTTIKKED